MSSRRPAGYDCFDLPCDQRDGAGQFMDKSLSPPFSVGKYLVSPSCRRTESGDYIAITSVRSGTGTGTHDRVFRFERRFACDRSALHFAAHEGRMLAANRSHSTR